MEIIDLTKFKIYKTNSNKGVLIFTGIGGSVNGYNDKYNIIANKIVSSHNASVFVFAVESWNEFDNLLSYAVNIIDQFYNSMDINDYELYAMGTSAGATFLTANAYKYPCIKKLLSINPVMHIDYNKFENGISKFNKQITIICGSQDPSIKNIPTIQKQNFANTKIVILEGVDHQFTEHFSLFLELPDKYLF